MKKILIIMGSDSDLPVVEKAFKVCRDYGVPFLSRVCSAHRTPEQAAELAAQARDQGVGVIIAAAGKAAHLAGALAGSTTLPIIGLPIKSDDLGGLDALLSTVQMPPGVPVATVGINAGENAALLALEMLAIAQPELAARLQEQRRAMADKVRAKDAALQEKLAQIN